MAWCFSKDCKKQWARHARIVYDTDLERFRWLFLQPEQAFWDLQTALEAIKYTRTAEEALEYVERNSADENIFGVCYDESAADNIGVPSEQLQTEARQLVQQAVKAFEYGINPKNRDRDEFLHESRATLRRAYLKDPNNLSVNLLLAESASRSGDFRTAVCEWLDVFLRLVSLERTLSQLGTSRQRVERAFTAYAKVVDFAKVEELGFELDLFTLIEHNYHRAISEITRRWNDILLWFQIVTLAGGLDWVRQTAVEANLPLGGMPGASLNSVKSLAEMANKLPHTDEIHQACLRAIPGLLKLLTASDARYRSAALDALVAIADPQCIAAIKRVHAARPNTRLQQALKTIETTIAERGAVWAK